MTTIYLIHRLAEKQKLLLMKSLFSFLMFSAAITGFTQADCINFGDYTQDYLNDVTSDHVTYPAGTAFITSGDLELIKPNTNSFYQFIDSAENEMCYIGELGIDVSSANYNCKKLSFDIVASNWIVIDGDSINSTYQDTIINNANWTYEASTNSGTNKKTITGNFDYVEVSTSTICISNICLSNCAVGISSCLDFSQYDAQYLQDAQTDHVAYPVGEAFMQSGDIEIIKVNTFTFFDFIDSTENEFCFVGDVGISVANSNYDCRSLTFELLGAIHLIVDGDTNFVTSNDTTIFGAGWSYQTETISGTLQVTVEGDFDYVQVGSSTTCLANICLDECNTSTPSCFDFTLYNDAFIQEVSNDDIAYPAGTTFMTQGDIQLVKPNLNSNYNSINNADNELYFTDGLAIDVSSANYACKKLTFNLNLGFFIIIDGDTNSVQYNDTTLYGAGWTYTTEVITGNKLITIEGDFDYVEFAISSHYISNICLEPCNTSTPSCFDFTVYDNAFLQEVSNDDIAYPAGSTFMNQGDIQLVKPNLNSNYNSINDADNEMFFTEGLGIDVSSANYACKKLTFNLNLGFFIIIDGDTNSVQYNDTTLFGAGWTYTTEVITGNKLITIEGDFDYVEFAVSSHYISNICLTECVTTPASCLDFTGYTPAFLQDVQTDHVTYEVGEAFITQGDIQLIKVDENTFYDFIDSTDNELCYVGTIGIDISTANYDCRVLNFDLVAGIYTIIDGDSILTPYNDTTIYGADWTYTTDFSSGNGEVTIEGEFDYVQIGFSTQCIGNICVYDCATAAVEEIQALETEIEYLLYPNPSNGALTIQTTAKYEQLLIHNMQGQLMQSHLSGDQHFDISDFENGFYLVSIILENGEVLSKKVLKQ